MRILVIATAVLALTVAAAQAQMGGGGRRHADDSRKTDNQPKVDDRAYKAALERIPEPKEKYDPWGGARPSGSATKPK